MASKFENWKTSVEIDYLSMYIKTWFAFLATAKELYPELISKSGDGQLINHYKTNAALPSEYDDKIRKHIEKVYELGMLIIKRDFPLSYFGYFFILNSKFNITKAITTKSKKSKINPTGENVLSLNINYREKTKIIKEPNLHISFKSNSNKFYENLGCYNLECNVIIQDLILKESYDKSDTTLNFIQESMSQKAIEVIQLIPDIELSEIEERKGYINGVILTLMQNLRFDFANETLFQPQPVKGFPFEYDSKQHKLKPFQWFIQFNYSLRNILFHHVIDPFDEQWLQLFKNAYLALQEVVENNIRLLRINTTQSVVVSIDDQDKSK